MTTAQLSAVLVSRGPVTVALTNPHDPDAFYQTRTGLYVYRSFRDRIVRLALPTQSASPVTLRRFVLDRAATDDDIEAELGPNHLFTESEVCWIIVEMIEKQEGGAAGDLNNSGNANQFYTPSCVVFVYWLADDREWLVYTWGRDDFVWGAGDSVFSRN
jgi:hypothetical protein